MRRPLPCMLAALTAAASLAGCAAGPVQIYDATRDRQGQALVASWKEVDIPAYFAAMRAQRAQLLQQEVDEASTAALANRDSLARLVLDHRIVARGKAGNALGLASLIEDRVAKLAGPIDFSSPGPGAGDALVAISHDNNAIETRQADLDVTSTAIFVKTRAHVTCESPPDAEVLARVKAMQVRADIESLLATCEKLRQAKANRDTAYTRIGGDIGRYARERRAEVVALEDRQHAAEVQAETLKEAAAAAGPDRAASSASDLIAAADRARKAIDALQSANDAFSDKLLAQARLKEIQAILQALHEGKAPDGAGKGIVAVAALPGLADDLQSLQDTTSMGPMTALLLRVQLETARLNNAQARIDLSRARLARYDDLLAAMASEARRLMLARETLESHLGELTAVAGLLAVSADGLDRAHARAARPAGGVATSVAAASLALLDTATAEELAADRQKLQLSSLANEETMTASEMNAQLYAALIDAVVQQTAAYAAIGIKGSDLTNIVGAVSLMWIGRGVNK